MTEHPEPVTATERLAARINDLGAISTDLVDVRDWLAEYWSTALPVPYVGWQPNHNRLQLQVQCYSDQFKAAVDALGRDTDNPPLVTTDDNGYRRAVRHFGTVQIEAWTPQSKTAGGAS